MKRKSFPSSEARKLEHVASRQADAKFDGTMNTCPYTVGGLYDGREIISIGFTTNVYGKYYHIIVERNKTHLRTKFEFDEKHDLKFVKPVETMMQSVREAEVQKLLAKANDSSA
ncbi:MAG: hypothetical protein CMC78_02955 [Flavobacteriaceae bacterium]|nr:hypothetical protein [Flavobacteriaceae bacterium]